jgi:antitoxin component YwqK of YwqJK toxin-antitoxin module
VGKALRDGTSKSYTESRQLESAENYSGGKLEGLQIHVTEDGHRVEEIFHHGIRSSMKRYAADGKLEQSEKYYEDGSRKKH